MVVNAAGLPYRSQFACRHAASRRALLQRPWRSPIGAINLAALQLQRCWRGWLVRNREKVERKRRGRKRAAAGAVRGAYPEKLYQRFQGDILELHNRYGGSGGGGGGNTTTGTTTTTTTTTTWSVSWTVYCAVRIQSWWRMIKVWRYFHRYRYDYFTIAAIQLQHAWRTYQQDRVFRMSSGGPSTASHMTDGTSYVEPGTFQRCARIIQRAWRSVTFYRIYCFYREMIRFHMQGDPKVLLKAINPGETHYFDRAAGVHVRFRLGGAIFPPNMYYKVYTHAPVADVGAFAPRNYAYQGQNTTFMHSTSSLKLKTNSVTSTSSSSSSSACRRAGSIRVGSSYFDTVVTTEDGKDESDWYLRQENNGWRPITITTLAGVDQDPVTKAWNDKTQPFHFSRIRRKTDVTKRKKLLKRQWLVSMHKHGWAKEVRREGGGSGGDSEDRVWKYDSTADSKFANRVHDAANNHEDKYYHDANNTSYWAAESKKEDTTLRQQEGSYFTSSNTQSYSSGYNDGQPNFNNGDDKNHHGNGGHKHGYDDGGYGGGLTTPSRRLNGASAVDFSSDGWEEDADALLEWTKELDYDAYHTHWQTFATSGASEPWVRIRQAAAAIAQYPSSSSLLMTSSSPSSASSSNLDGGGGGGGSGGAQEAKKAVWPSTMSAASVLHHH